MHINFPILWKLLLQSNTVNSVFSTKKNDYPSVGGGSPILGNPASLYGWPGLSLLICQYGSYKDLRYWQDNQDKQAGAGVVPSLDLVKFGFRFFF